jgi:hypothetical protein
MAVVRISFGILLLLVLAGARFETTAQVFRFLPGGTIFPPPAAHLQEARTGLRKEAGSSRMKLDIGTVLDVVEFRPDGDSTLRVRAGAELFAFALTTSARGLRLQVDALDGFFGGHITLRSGATPTVLSVRLRFMHLSSHLVDGHYDTDHKMWIGGKEPVPFTRDFGELTGSLATATEDFGTRVYAGVHYATLIRPDDLLRWTGIGGAEVRLPGVPGWVLGQPSHLYGAANVTLAGGPEAPWTFQVEAGIRFGPPEGSGMRVYFSWYRGRGMFSQYYMEETDNWGVGFAFDVW